MKHLFGPLWWLQLLKAIVKDVSFGEKIGQYTEGLLALIMYLTSLVPLIAYGMHHLTTPLQGSSIYIKKTSITLCIIVIYSVACIFRFQCLPNKAPLKSFASINQQLSDNPYCHYQTHSFGDCVLGLTCPPSQGLQLGLAAIALPKFAGVVHPSPRRGNPVVPDVKIQSSPWEFLPLQLPPLRKGTQWPAV